MSGGSEIGSFEQRLESLDVGLLGTIMSMTTPEDRRSLLALHQACRSRYGQFRWLEIGSAAGGSLQALVRDPACTAIESIDSRPEHMSDERVGSVSYSNNSTERMLEELGRLPGAETEKIRTHDCSTDQLQPDMFEPVRVCFIDGEHTDEACARDAEFCRRVVRDNGVIAFHDVWIVYNAVAEFVEGLRAEGIPNRSAYLPDVIFTVELGEGGLLGEPAIASCQADAGEGVLRMLQRSDYYRRVLKGRRARLLRRLGLLRVEDTSSPGDT